MRLTRHSSGRLRRSLNSNVRPRMRSIATTLCILEPQVVAHAPEMFNVLSDPAIYEFENAPPESEEWLVKRFAKLESRTSKDGSELWLNWVVKVATGRLAGYVQATVQSEGVAYIAYELASAYWLQGIGSSAVGAMLSELAGQYEVRTFLAVLKASNYRSLALLRHLGFSAASQELVALAQPEPDELVMALQLPSATFENAV